MGNHFPFQKYLWLNGLGDIDLWTQDEKNYGSQNSFFKYLTHLHIKYWTTFILSIIYIIKLYKLSLLIFWHLSTKRTYFKLFFLLPFFHLPHTFSLFYFFPFFFFLSHTHPLSFFFLFSFLLLFFYNILKKICFLSFSFLFIGKINIKWYNFDRMFNKFVYKVLLIV